MRIIQIDNNLPVFPSFKRIAAYARVSSAYEETEHSLIAQITHYEDYFKARSGVVFLGVFSDFGVTGTKKDRPGLDKLLSLARGGKVDIIYTKSISRFARNTVDLLSIARELKDHGTGIYFEKENINTLSKEGELMLSLLASFAQEESRSISENVKWSIRKRFENGIPNNVNLYGYRWNGEEFVIEEKEADVVRFIFSSYLKGNTPDKIASALSQRGIKGLRGNGFSYSKVCDTLRCENYTGDTTLQKTYRENHITHKCLVNKGRLPQYFVEEAYPILIDKETFLKVQDEIARRSKRGYWASTTINFNPFTSLIYCSSCGKAYRRKKKGKLNVWVCSTKHERGVKECASDNIPERLLYALTEEVLCIPFDREVFSRTISRIEVESKALHFFLKDGREVIKPWQKDRNGHILKEAVNG